MTRECECGCGEAMTGSSNWKYKRGHKPKDGPPSNALAKRESEITIDAPGDDAEEWIECSLSRTQIDLVYGMLTLRQKALAVLNALQEE